MDIVPRLSRILRRHLLRLGRESGNPATALRFHATARLGLGKTSSEAAEELDLARSTVVRTAHRFAEEGSAGLYDKRRRNGKPKAGDAFRRHLARLLLRTPEHFGWPRPTWNEKFYLAGALDVRTGALHTTGAARKGVALFCAHAGVAGEELRT